MTGNTVGGTAAKVTGGLKLKIRLPGGLKTSAPNLAAPTAQPAQQQQPQQPASTAPTTASVHVSEGVSAGSLGINKLRQKQQQLSAADQPLPQQAGSVAGVSAWPAISEPSYAPSMISDQRPPHSGRIVKGAKRPAVSEEDIVDVEDGLEDDDEDDVGVSRSRPKGHRQVICEDDEDEEFQAPFTKRQARPAAEVSKPAKEKKHKHRDKEKKRRRTAQEEEDDALDAELVVSEEEEDYGEASEDWGGEAEEDDGEDEVKATRVRQRCVSTAACVRPGFFRHFGYL